MSDFELEVLRRRVAMLEFHVSQLEARLSALPGVPTVIVDGSAPPVQGATPSWNFSESAPPPGDAPHASKLDLATYLSSLSSATKASSATANRSEAGDIEYFVATKIGLKLGAAMVCLAIAFLVSIGVQRGLITPKVQFSGALILCLALTLLGCVKRDEKEQFGQILMGAGSCGAYLTFAGGYVYQHFYDGSLLAELYIGLSIVNFGFAIWRSSKSFLSIAVIGGFAAALMPASRSEIEVALGIHLLIAATACAVILWNRWRSMVLALFAVLAPVGLTIATTRGSGPTWFRSAEFDVSCLFAIWTYARCVSADLFDEWRVGVPIGLCLAALCSLFLPFPLSPFQDWNPWAVGSVASFGLLAGVTTLGLPKSRSRAAMLIGSAILVLLVAPLALGGREGAEFFAASSMLLGVLSHFRLRLFASILALCQFGLGIGYWCATLSGSYEKVTMPWTVESLVMLALTVGGLASSLGIAQDGKIESKAVGSIGVLISGMTLARLIALLIHADVPGVRLFAGTGWGLGASALLFGGAFISCSIFRRVDPGVPLGLALVALLADWTLPSYIQARTLPIEAELLFAASAIVGVLAYVRLAGRVPLCLYVFAAMTWDVSTRIFQELPLRHLMNADATVTFGWIAALISLFMVGFAKEVREFRLSAMGLVALVVAKVLLWDLANYGGIVRVGVCLLIGLVGLVGGYFYIRRQGKLHPFAST